MKANLEGYVGMYIIVFLFIWSRPYLTTRVGWVYGMVNHMGLKSFARWSQHISFASHEVQVLIDWNKHTIFKTVPSRAGIVSKVQWEAIFMYRRDCVWQRPIHFLCTHKTKKTEFPVTFQGDIFKTGYLGRNPLDSRTSVIIIIPWDIAPKLLLLVEGGGYICVYLNIVWSGIISFRDVYVIKTWD